MALAGLVGRHPPGCTLRWPAAGPSVIQVERQRRHRHVRLSAQSFGERPSALVVEDLVTMLARHDLRDEDADHRVLRVDGLYVIDHAPCQGALRVEEHLQGLLLESYNGKDGKKNGGKP